MSSMCLFFVFISYNSDLGNRRKKKSLPKESDCPSGVVFVAFFFFFFKEEEEESRIMKFRYEKACL